MLLSLMAATNSLAASARFWSPDLLTTCGSESLPLSSRFATITISIVLLKSRLPFLYFSLLCASQSFKGFLLILSSIGRTTPVFAAMLSIAFSASSFVLGGFAAISLVASAGVGDGFAEGEGCGVGTGLGLGAGFDLKIMFGVGAGVGCAIGSAEPVGFASK